ncbi:S26 family signal peptidase [Bradyrhizobium sp. dw_411]|uniref:S26 family signal peptidase n=1 Tax=Bradyrhizobium sp. dw_411 TaxID=2720082 RepID=UPI001BCBC59E|nr:S26 family signal peptidase [Bradyrhizobium sp. dw_411]
MTPRTGCTFAASLAVISLLATVGAQPRPHYIWNLTPSVPLGLYAVQPPDRLYVTMLVVVTPPEPLATTLSDGGYLPRGVPLLKRILALSGQTVCRLGGQIIVDGIAAAAARERDLRGRPLPVWQGCRVIADDEVFLMNWDTDDSLDGRYFGPLPRSAVVARAVPIWTDEDGEGHFVWRAPTH